MLLKDRHRRSWPVSDPNITPGQTAASSSSALALLLSEHGLHQKSLRFHGDNLVGYVPTRREYLCADLWWTGSDYCDFRQARWQEQQSGLDVSLESQWVESQQESIDLRILIVSSDSLIKSSLTRHLSAALKLYEEELETNSICQDHNVSSCGVLRRHNCRKVRFTVTQVAHNTKEYALAIQGDLHYNVILYDNGRRRNSDDEARHPNASSPREREHRQSASYAHSSRNSCIINTEQMDTTINGVDLSPLLQGSDSLGESTFDEKTLLRKVIKSGTALGYIVNEATMPSDTSDCSSGDSEPVQNNQKGSSLPVPVPMSGSVSPAGRTSQSLDRPNSPDHHRPVSPMINSSLFPSRVSSEKHYSLLRDHADVVVDPMQREREALVNSSWSLSSSPASDIPPPPPYPPCPTSTSSIVAAHRVPTVEDWLVLFRTAKPLLAHSSEVASQKTPTSSAKSAINSGGISLLSLELRGVKK